MTKPEYQYDENLSAAKNIATGLFAIANEMSRLIDNTFEQSKKASDTQREDLQEISKTIKNIFESIKVIYPKNEIQEQPIEPYFDFDTSDISSALNRLTKELVHIKNILIQYFDIEDDEYNYDSND